MRVNILRYSDVKCHNISISWLGYDMNPSQVNNMIAANATLPFNPDSLRYSRYANI